MEQKLVCDDRLDVARRLYHALCAQYPDRFIAFSIRTAYVSRLAAIGRTCPLEKLRSTLRPSEAIRQHPVGLGAPGHHDTAWPAGGIAGTALARLCRGR